MPVAFEYIWGDTLVELDEHGCDVRIVNLETTITPVNEFSDSVGGYKTYRLFHPPPLSAK